MSTIFSILYSRSQCRSSHKRCSVKIGVLKNFSNFTGKHLYWSLFLIKLQTCTLLLSILLSMKKNQQQHLIHVAEKKSLMNKNTLTGRVNYKKTARHHAQLSLCAKSRKTNYAKSKKWPKTSIWAIF